MKTHLAHQAPRQVVLTILTCLLCAAVPARAELSDEIQVYTDDINDPGEFGLELHVNTTPRGRRTPNYPGEATTEHGWRATPEFSYGINRNWEAGLYVSMERSASGRMEVAGAKVRLKWLPVRAQDSGWFFGANAELSWLKKRYSQSRTTAELRLMAGWRDPAWLFAANPVFGWNLSDPTRSSDADLSLGAKAARTIGPSLATGLEFYADAGTLRNFDFSRRQAKVLYAALDAKISRFDINFGVGRGLNAAADRWTLKAILGMPL